MLKSLHAIKLMKPPSMFMPDATPKASGMFTIEAINVNVEKLETDEDYEEIARRVGESIYNEMVKGAPVGGLRLR